MYTCIVFVYHYTGYVNYAFADFRSTIYKIGNNTSYVCSVYGLRKDFGIVYLAHMHQLENILSTYHLCSRSDYLIASFRSIYFLQL